MQFLLANEANINDANDDGTDAIIVASQKGSVKVVQLLLVNGENVNHGNNNGADALIMASQEGHVEAVQVLLARGATKEIAKAHAIAKGKAHCHCGHSHVLCCELPHHTPRVKRDWDTDEKGVFVCVGGKRGDFETALS